MTKIQEEVKPITSLTKEEFDSIVELPNEQGIELQPTNLNPVDPLKLKDLPEVFINFKNEIWESINRSIGKKDRSIKNDDKIFMYTDFKLPDSSEENDYIFDGLSLTVNAGNITDAVLLELKSEKRELNEKYLHLARKYEIAKFLTISDESAEITRDSLPHNLSIGSENLMLLKMIYEPESETIQSRLF